MAATDSLTSVAFPADISAPGCWDPHVPAVPYSSAMTLPDTDNIIAELSMLESAISTPGTSDTNPLPPTPPPKRPAPSAASAPPAKKHKHSPCLASAVAAAHHVSSPASLASCPPFTPPQQSKPEASLFVSSPLTSPVSPTGSLCSDAAVDDMSSRHSHQSSHRTPPLSPSSTAPASQHNSNNRDNSLSTPHPAPALARPVLHHAPRRSPASVPTHSAHRPPASPLPADLSALPALTREHTKRRRALRRAALNRSRDRRAAAHCMSAAVKTEPSALGAPGSPSMSCSRLSVGSTPSSPRRSSRGLSVDGGCGLDMGPGASSGSVGSDMPPTGPCGGKRENELAGSAMGGEHVDKKAARAIRNREAAMKSRIEAKQKMKKLQDENHTLAVKVKSLTQENESLTTQLKSLLSTLGVNVTDGQDVKSVMSMLARMGSGNRGAMAPGSAVGTQGV